MFAGIKREGDFRDHLGSHWLTMGNSLISRPTQILIASWSWQAILS